MKEKGFTLIEILVVVLIIGILAAIALPQYQESVEKSIIREALVNLKTITQAQDVFIMQNGRKATDKEMEKLDIAISGATDITTYGPKRIATKYFLYSPGGSGDTLKALAHRLPIQYESAYNQSLSRYFIYIDENGKLGCSNYTHTTGVQRKLCSTISQQGYL